MTKLDLIKDYVEILNDFFNKGNPRKHDIDYIEEIINGKLPNYFNDIY